MYLHSVQLVYFQFIPCYLHLTKNEKFDSAEQLVPLDSEIRCDVSNLLFGLLLLLFLFRSHHCCCFIYRIIWDLWGKYILRNYGDLLFEYVCHRLLMMSWVKILNSFSIVLFQYIQQDLLFIRVTLQLLCRVNRWGEICTKILAISFELFHLFWKDSQSMCRFLGYLSLLAITLSPTSNCTQGIRFHRISYKKD